VKAMILAAGLGTRMRPLTDSCPKPLLQVADKALIDYHLEKLARAGVREVVVNSAWLAEQILGHLGNGERYGLAIQHSVEDAPLETAGGIINALPLLGGEPFLLVNGDIWTELDFAPLLALKPDGAHLLLTDNPDHHPSGDFGIAADGKLIPPGLGQSYTFMGVSVWHPRVFSGLPTGARALKPIIDQLIAEQRVTATYFSGQWLDVGTPERLRELDTQLRARHC
jgi:N-acetyl-alpha-D-muramate 1-phosphate uridylyltransferase